MSYKNKNNPHSGKKNQKRQMFKIGAAGLSFLVAVTAIFSNMNAQKAYANFVELDPNIAPKIRVDGLGYRPNDKKIAILVNPQSGFNSTQKYTPSSTIQLKRATDNTTVLTITPTVWNGGATETSSGDKVWHADFSSYTTPGEYYLFDQGQNVNSEKFKIAEDVYRPALIAATRFFYHQRANVAKTDPQAQGHAVGADYTRANQDTAARDVNDQGNAAKAKDLTGGWWDAGDTNKYVTFAEPAVHQLLRAYKQSPTIFTDDFNIPESGNGVPDIIDEIKVELDWLKKMQDTTDGKFLNKVGYIQPQSLYPETDTRQRFYDQKCTSSTIAGASMFAHAALVLKDVPGQASYAQDLQNRAVQAYNAFESAGNNLETNCDTGEVQSGNADRSAEVQRGSASVASVYLFALTGNTKYENDLNTKYLSSNGGYTDPIWNVYRPHEGDALLDYIGLGNANSTVKNAINTKYNNNIQYNSPTLSGNQSSYAYIAGMPDDQYHWGSNQVVANIGNANLDRARVNATPTRNQEFRDRALAQLNYIHGRNALGMSFVTNGSGNNTNPTGTHNLGFGRAVKNSFHSMFSKNQYDTTTGTKAMPAGYIVGGVNRDYGFDRQNNTYYVPTTDIIRQHITSQPLQKKYLDTNKVDPERPWEITETGIYYQSAYLRLLSQFVTTTANNFGSSSSSSSVSSSSMNNTSACTNVNLSSTLGSTWTGGYAFDINAVSSRSDSLGNWSATFNLPTGSVITNNWNNTYTISGNTVTFRSSQTWNSSINPGSTNLGGFAISGNSEQIPNSFLLYSNNCQTVSSSSSSSISSSTTSSLTSSSVTSSSVSSSVSSSCSNKISAKSIVTSTSTGRYTFNISVKNSSKTQTLNDWTAVFTLPKGATILGNTNNNYTLSGSTVTVRPSTSNGSVAPGATVSFGTFTLSGNSTSKPNIFTITPRVCS